ncbi:acetyl-CoA acetyltransferase [Nocardia callitridis]|uniref:Acetyl-CoA acetyltransferase n=1 Tax=Nocardia callitridis TaxID=648753 RepID=A0ABP9KVS7_9NOCA
MIDPCTPVLVGVGQVADSVDDLDYRQWSSVDLATVAARRAVDDTAADYATVAASVEVVAGVRQFEISAPVPAPLGRSDNYPRSVARRMGIDPGHAVLEVVGGQGPQHLVTEFASAIAAGRLESVLLVGSDAISTERFYAGRADKPDFTEAIGGQLEDRGFGYESFLDENLIRHAAVSPPTQYGLLENARRARLGATPAEYRMRMAELFAPFTCVAAKNPLAGSQVVRSAAELATVTASNRMICDPYPRLLVARDLVNQGAAVVLMSVSKARELDVPQEKWVYLRGHCDLVEQPLLERVDLGGAPTATMAAREALRVAGIGLDDIAAFDLYSCFPIAVFNFCEGMDLPTDDPRGLTVTGGLPFFGGPGNNYSMHAIAEIVSRMRERPGDFGLVGANGGIMSKYSVGVYSTAPADWVPDRAPALQQAVSDLPSVDVRPRAEGAARIETYTARAESGTGVGLVIGRMVADDTRFLAAIDPESLGAVGDPIGQDIVVTAGENGNSAVMRN